MLPQLQQLGFTRNEANVYFAALKLGSTSVQQLAKSTGLNRVTVHSICEKFERLQVFHSVYHGKRRQITAMDPEYLKNLLNKEEQVLQAKQGALASILPNMREMYRQQQRGMNVTTFRGERGYEQICEDILTTRADMFEYANFDTLSNVIESYVIADYLPRKHKLGIRSKFLYIDTPIARRYIQDNYLDNPGSAPMEVKFIPSDEFNMESFFVLYADKLAILTPSTLDAVIIQDAGMVAALQPFFQFVWDRAGAVVSNQGGNTIDVQDTI